MIALALLLALLLATLFGAYLFITHLWWFPAGASAHAPAIDHQLITALWVLGSLFVAGHIVLGVVVWRGRSRATARFSRGNWRYEVSWTLGIACLFFWFNIAAGRVWSSVTSADASSASALQVEVTGIQFQWYFRYAGPDGRLGRVDAQRFARPDEGNPLGLDPADPAGKDDIISTSLVLPAGREVELTLRAQDVIHSVFIPVMRVKQDAVPGMETHMRFRPVETGTYELVCSQLCGIGHHRMRAVVRVVSEDEFEKWLGSHGVHGGS